MSGMHCTVAVLLLAMAAPAAAEGPAGAQAGAAERSASFTIFAQGTAIGSEQVTVKSGPFGWTIAATGRIGAPVNLVTARFEARYDSGWTALGIDIEASQRGQPLLMHTTIAGGTATSEITQAGKVTQKTDKVSPDTIIIPNMFFAAYEALALRLESAVAGTIFKTWIAPQLEIDTTVQSIEDERIQTPRGTLQARHFTLVASNPTGPMTFELWTERGAGHMIRFRLAPQGLEVAREDVAAVGARVEHLSRENDEKVSAPSNGFSLAGTVSKPAVKPAPGARWPAVVLVPGAAAVDRDETMAGIPLFAQIAGALADAGFVVVRYDKRGAGQSGGRDEAATLADYADDVRAVVTMASKRRDVDSARISVVGYGEGGMIGMLAAAQEKKIALVALIAAPGVGGADLVLEQQKHLLDTMTIPDAEKQARIELQKKIQKAVLAGSGWEGIPPAFRRQAETPWFQSFLKFNPAEVMPRVKRPILVLHGELDREVAVAHAERLAALARARKENFGVNVFVFPGLNHLLVPAKTGETAEYASLGDKTVSRELVEKLAWWLAEGYKGAAAAGAAKVK